MTIGLIIGAVMFVLAAILGERHALWIPSVVLLVAAATYVPAGSL